MSLLIPNQYISLTGYYSYHHDMFHHSFFAYSYEKSEGFLIWAIMGENVKYPAILSAKWSRWFWKNVIKCIVYNYLFISKTIFDNYA